MKILHTSDWHLGKKLFRLDRTHEHQLFLDWIIHFIITEDVDLLMIAGDIFDVPTPPHQSLEIFYEFLYRLSLETKAYCCIIAGNHDSGQLIDAPSKILEHHRISVWGRLSTDANQHWKRICLKGETIDLCAIPFFRSYELLPNGEGVIIEALKKYFTRDKVYPQILMLHHIAGKFESTGSEQVVSLSGIDSIPTELLKLFDYVALGHIHKAQKIAPNAFYSGSPLPMRFSETQKKSMRLIEVKNGQLSSQEFLIPEWRKFHLIKTNLKEWKKDIAHLSTSSTLTSMAEVQIDLDEPIVGLIDQIKTDLKEKNIELLSFIPNYQIKELRSQSKQKIFELGLPDIFEEFYKQKYPESKQLPNEVKSDFIELIQKAKNATHQIKD